MLKLWSGLGALGLIALLPHFGCSDDRGRFERAGLPTLELSDDGINLPTESDISILPNSTSEDRALASELRISNSGNIPLEVTDLELLSDPPGALLLAGGPSGEPLPELPQLIASADDDGPRDLRIYLMLNRSPGLTPKGKLRIHSNSTSKSGVVQPIVEYDIAVEQTRPTLQVLPTALNLGTVPRDETAQAPLTLLNQGNDTLVVSSFILRGHPRFEVLVGATPYGVDEASAAGIVLETPLRIEAGATTQIAARYSAADGEAATAELILFSNDPAHAEGLTVPLRANVGGPCVKVDPRRVDFGGKLIGRTAVIDVEITSCGTEPLEVDAITLTDASSGEFELALADLEGAPTTGPLTAPVKLAAGETGLFQVVYVPEDLSPKNADGSPVPDTATIRIHSNAFESELTTAVSGFGVDRECPTAVIHIPEGEEVIPQTTLRLVGSQSYAASGTLRSYRWEVDQPNGSRSVFLPSASVADPTFEVNAAGLYRFRLTVEDSTGEPSCVPAEAEVFVNPDEAIHIELLWRTPNDPDETDHGPAAGADLDLHFVHPLANGGFDGDDDGKPDGYFDNPFDTYFGNSHRNWGSMSAAADDNPSLDRDDTDGAGPENLNLNRLEEGARYKVGVHYWKDHGLGMSFATVRIYLFGVLAFEVADIELAQLDMWTVTEFDWPPTPGNPPTLTRVCAGTTDACTSNSDCGGNPCGLRIAPNYIHPWVPYEFE